ncbi:unnamed protein product, partial [marine sediment metagenome]
VVVNPAVLEEDFEVGHGYWIAVITEDGTIYP